MKSGWLRWLFTGLFALLCMQASVLRAQPGQESRGREDILRQVAGVLDYIGGDYRGAVSADGTILSEPEFVEQKELAKDALALTSSAGIAPDSSLGASLAEISKALEEKAQPAKVAALCKRTRDMLERDYGVSLAPKSLPSRQDAMRLYTEQGCNSCHGDDGGANTPAAKALDPQPANFLDAERVATVSAHRAFHAITFGVQGTAMTAFAPRLSDAERWSLSFYVLALRHGSADLAAGKREFEAAKKPAPDTARGLAALSEEELIAKLTVLRSDDARRNALAYLRAEAPFVSDQAAVAGYATTYSKLDEGLSAYRAGQASNARQLFISAYLDGFEPHEASLRAHDSALVDEIERAMLTLRAAAADGGKVEQVEKHVAAVRTLLLRAESARGGSTAAFLGALTITLREGLEIVLLVAALLALVRKRGRAELVRYVHLGWLSSVPAGLLTFWFAGSIFGGMERELAEGIAAIVAAVVLLGVTHWLLGQLGAKQWVGFLAKRMNDATTGSGAAFGVFSLAFLAAYREAFEIVLFFQALVLDAGDAVNKVWLGAALGLVLLAIIAVGLLRVGQRLKPAPFMLASSIFLALLSLVLIGKGVRALQEAGVVGITPLHSFPELPLAGIFASVEGFSAQGVLLLLLVSSALLPWWKARSAGSTQVASTS